jgi:hypothetical protein
MVGKCASSECCHHPVPIEEGAESQAANVLLQITYLNSVVMPDEEPSDSSEDEEEEGDGSDAGGGEEGDEA